MRLVRSDEGENARGRERHSCGKIGSTPLGGAISYILKHWEKLTRFLRVPGALLDNNLCERAIKQAILHRKSVMFFKTQNGDAGNLFMSQIHAREFCSVNSFDYVTELDRHADQFESNPADGMLWNYGQALAPPSRCPPPPSGRLTLSRRRSSRRKDTTVSRKTLYRPKRPEKLQQ